MKRRDFLHNMAHAAAVPTIFGATASNAIANPSISKLLSQMSEEGRVLVLVFLEGGNDGLNTVIPMSELSAMNKVRPHVTLPEDKLLRLIGTDLGIHPSMVDMKSLYSEGRFGIIQNVGYPEPDFSHFRSTDIWMSGANSEEILTSGWTGRYLDQLHPDYPEAYPNDQNPHPLAIELGYGSSLLFQGESASMGMVISGPDDFHQLINNVEPEYPDTQAGEQLRYVRLIARQSQQYGDVVKRASASAGTQLEYPETDIAQQLKIVSRLISGGLETPLFMVRLGGFDTHDMQVQPDDKVVGEHATLLRELNDGILAFMKDLEFKGTSERVIGMTFSEFGRTVTSNASNGTDHGTSGPLFLFGNAIKGGVTGSNPVVPQDATWEYDLPLEYDFRQVYGSVLEQWLGVNQNSEREKILGQQFETFEVIGESTILGIDSDRSDLRVFPNPIGDKSTIQFHSDGGFASIDLIDMNGRRLEKIHRANFSPGIKLVNWDTSKLPSGHYLIQLTHTRGKQFFRVLK